MHPVDSEVAAGGLGRGDEVTAELGSGGGRRGVLGSLDLAVVGYPVDQRLALQQVEQAAATADVVVGQVELGDAGVGQVEPAADPTRSPTG